MPTQPELNTVIDIARIRDQFPALAGDTIFLDNAGGSQIPKVVADAMHRYMLESYVQLGAGYRLSEISTQTVEDAHQFINLLMNGTETGHVILGPSCTQHCFMLASCYAAIMEPGDEIIVSRMGHEANVVPWTRIQKQGFKVNMWEVDAATYEHSLDELESLLSERTRILALPHVSNLLGGIVDVKPVIELAHRYGARVVLDGVAYASHRAIDVKSWDVDWYIYSTYKVYGPHMSALYGKHEAIAELTGPNLDFIPKDEVPYKFELGGVSHEGCAGLLALGEYLKFLAGREKQETCDRAAIESAYEVMTELEVPMQTRVIEYLLSKPGLQVVGPNHGKSSRVGTICFRSDRVTSADITAGICAANIGARHGHMYAPELCEKLGIDLADGLARVSLLHYNTMQEMDRLIEVLEDIL